MATESMDTRGDAESATESPCRTDEEGQLELFDVAVASAGAWSR